MKPIGEIAHIIQGWIDWSRSRRAEEGLDTHPNTHIMQVPVWPTVGVMSNWVEAINQAEAENKRLREDLTGLVRSCSTGEYRNDGTPAGRQIPTQSALDSARTALGDTHD